jgi:hypothetical protein
VKLLARPSVLIPAAFFAGLAAIAAGVAMVYPPAGVILAGVLLVAGAAKAEQQWGKPKPDPTLTSTLEDELP